MTRTIRLRPWQKAAFDAFVEADSPDFLAVATPGAGKTTFALACARYELGRRPTRLVVVAPTAHLKLQWSNAAAAVGLHLDPAWSPASGLAGDLHGVVTTYQQVASAAGSLRALADGAFVILDEIHHAADERPLAPDPAAIVPRAVRTRPEDVAASTKGLTRAVMAEVRNPTACPSMDTSMTAPIAFRAQGLPACAGRSTAVTS